MSNKEKFLEIVKNYPEEIWEEFRGIFGPDDWAASCSDSPESYVLILEKIFEKKDRIDIWMDFVSSRKSQAEFERQQIIDAFNVFLYINEGKELKDYKIDDGIVGQDLAKRIREVKLKKLLG